MSTYDKSINTNFMIQGPGLEPLLLRLRHEVAVGVGEDRLHRARHRQV